MRDHGDLTGLVSTAVSLGGGFGYAVERLVDCGDDVLVVAREQGRGAASGYREFYDEAAALEAVGLSE